MLFADDGKRLAPPPRRVAILGMAPTLADFQFLRLQNPGPGAFVDEIWGLNNAAVAMNCDVAFIMDDFVEMLERPYMGNEKLGKKPALFWDATNTGLMQWAREECKIPILTSKAYRPRYPTSCTFPLDDVLHSVFGKLNIAGFHLSNSTSYAVAMAWHLGVQQIHLYGCDFAYPWHDPYDQRRTLEASRANVEALLLAGFMLGKFTFHLSARTSLFDTMDGRPFYGYADGRKAMTPEMIKDKRVEDITNDERTIPADADPKRNPALAGPAVQPDGGSASDGSTLTLHTAAGAIKTALPQA